MLDLKISTTHLAEQGTIMEMTGGKAAPWVLTLLAGMLLACGAQAPAQEQQPPAAAEQEPEGSHSLAFQPPDGGGFLRLFNGENLDGWTIMGDSAGWSVENGMIRSEGQHGGEWLRFNEPQSDFILKLDWRVSRDGNSGVYIRAAEAGLPWETGYEIQISNALRDDLHCTCSLYGYAAVDPRPDESADTWHTFEIHARGPEITVFSDGTQCAEFDQTKSEAAREKPLTGFVGIQDSHAGDGSYVEYRNIQLKLL